MRLCDCFQDKYLGNMARHTGIDGYFTCMGSAGTGFNTPRNSASRDFARAGKVRFSHTAAN
jgi:hypothetical protein